MKPESPKQEELIPGSAWTASIELGAGIYFLEGGTHLAGHQTLAEQRLLERGALLIATVRFDREPLEGTRPFGAVRRLASGEAARLFRPAARSS